MKLIFNLLLLICCAINLKGQVVGQVFDRATRAPIDKVDVFNINNNKHTSSNFKGEFKIDAKANDVLVFKMPGYKSDTVLLINIKPLRRYLEAEVNMLNTVTVKSKSLREQYAQTFNKANAVLLKKGRGLLFYPSAYFSREGKNARKLKRMIKQEEIDLQIDRKFNAKIVTSILPLKQPELDAFMVMYRPTLKFVNQKSAEDIKFYLYDCYNKFKLLPAAQKVLPSLKIDSLN